MPQIKLTGKYILLIALSSALTNTQREQKGELNTGQQSLSVELLQQQEALGRSKGGFSTKIHIQAEGMGKPMQFVLSEGQRSDIKGFATLNTALKVKRTGRGNRSNVLVT